MKRINRFLSISVVAALLTFTVTLFSGCEETEDPKELSSDKEITAFGFTTPAAVGVINETAKTIAVSVPAGTDVKALVPTIVMTGVSVSPPSGVANDFTSPVTYTVTAEDKTMAPYTVTVSVGTGPAGGELTNAMINQSSSVTIPKGVYTVPQNLTLTANHTLTLSPGVVLLFAQGRGFTVESGARLIANGTAADKIEFNSGVTVTNRQAGDWSMIELNGSDCEFDYCVFDYGGGNGDGYGMLYIVNVKAKITNCTFSNSRYSGILLWQANSGFSSFTNNTMTNCGETDANSYPIRAWSTLASLDNIGNGNTITTAKGIGVDGGRIEKNTSLKALPAPYVFANTVTVAGGYTLTIDPGATLKFGKEKGIYVEQTAKLKANGTSTGRIKFTSSKTLTAPSADNWGMIEIRGSECEFDYCDFEYGGSNGDGYGMIYIVDVKPSITNCTLSNSLYSGILLWEGNSGFTAFSNNSITNCGETVAGSYPIQAYTGLYNLEKIGTSSGNTIQTAKGIGVAGGYVSSNMTVKAAFPYLFYGTPTINGNATLTIEAGATLKFNQGTGINVNGGAKILADGTSSPITFTSSKASGKLAGDWNMIEIRESDGSDFKNCVFEYGAGGGAGYGMLYLINCKAGFTNCTFKDSKFSGILLWQENSGFSTFTGNTLTNCGEVENNAYPIEAYSGIMNLKNIGAGNTIGDFATTKGIGIAGSYVNANLTLGKYVYTIIGNLTIQDPPGGSGVTLTVAAGAKLKFGQNVSINVESGGRLIAKGTATDKITFTGTNTNKGWWGGLNFITSLVQPDSELDHCILSGGGSTAGNSAIVYCYETYSKTQLKIRNTVISRSGGWGIFRWDEYANLDIDATVTYGTGADENTLGNINRPY
jgi:hypothetical protein